MKAFRSAYFIAFILCIPLFIWCWGSIFNLETDTNARLLVKRGITILYYLQISAILLSIPFFIRNNSALESFQACCLLILVPLPFIVVAWLAAAVSIEQTLKMLLTLIFVSAVVSTFGGMFKRPQFSATLPFNLLLPLCLTALIIIWHLRPHWEAWLNQ